MLISVYQGMILGHGVVHAWRELLEADTNASARNPLPISVDRPIRRMRGLDLVGRIVSENSYVLSICSDTSGRRMTVVAVKSRRALNGFMIRRPR